MMSRIGTKAFTLIEVMGATCILALGTVLIYQALFIASDSLNYYSNYLNVASLANEKVWQAQDSLAHFCDINDIETNGVFVNNRHFSWNLSYEQRGGQKDVGKLFRIDLTVIWREGNRAVSITRSAYALCKGQG